jgi:hypothetical protein
MTDQDWRRVSKGLVVTLAVLVLAVVAVVILRPGNPDEAGSVPSSSPFTVAGASPSPRLSQPPSPSARRSPGASPRVSPSPEASASPSPEPSVAASPSPSRVPAVPLRSIRFLRLGIDGPAPDITPKPRTLTFVSQGPGQVTATLGQTSAGNVRFCLFTGDQPSGNDCRTTSHAALVGSTKTPGTTRWRVSLIGVDQGTSPSANVKLEFRSNAPRVTIDGFRFQGIDFADYNGITAQFKVGAGDVVVNGSWDGAARPWKGELVTAQSGEKVGSNSGTGNSASLTATVGAGSYQLTLENTEMLADQEVFLHAVIRWP